MIIDLPLTVGLFELESLSNDYEEYFLHPLGLPLGFFYGGTIGL
jgi:hypothetical protein